MAFPKKMSKHWYGENLYCVGFSCKGIPIAAQDITELPNVAKHLVGTHIQCHRWPLVNLVSVLDSILCRLRIPYLLRGSRGYNPCSCILFRRQWRVCIAWILLKLAQVCLSWILLSLSSSRA
ncbi:hypothetical protein YC2023_069422 [Brassica napus]